MEGTDPGHGARRGMGKHVAVDGEGHVRIRMAEDAGGCGDVAIGDQVARASVPDVVDPGVRRQSGTLPETLEPPDQVLRTDRRPHRRRQHQAVWRDLAGRRLVVHLEAERSDDRRVKADRPATLRRLRRVAVSDAGSLKPERRPRPKSETPSEKHLYPGFDRARSGERRLFDVGRALGNGNLVDQHSIAGLRDDVGNRVPDLYVGID